MVIYKLSRMPEPRGRSSPRSQEHISSITHHFEDGSKLLFPFIDRKLFFKAAVSRRALRQGVPAPLRVGGWAPRALRPPPSCRICLGVKRGFSPLPGPFLLKLVSF